MNISNEFLNLQQMKFDLFKEQNPETGFFDVVFEVEGKLLYAYKAMLNIASTTFASMLSNRWASNNDEPIKIEGYGYDDFYQFLTYLYSGQCELTESNIYAMVDIAEFYGVDLFKAYCEKYLSTVTIATENAFQMMELADKYSLIQHKALAHDFITKNFQSLADSDGFLYANKCIINQIVLAIKDDIKPDDLFLAVYKWSEKQAMDKQAADPNLNLNDAIKTGISDFLPCIDFMKMELKFFTKFVVSHGFIFSSYHELSKILCDRLAQSLLRSRIKVTNINGQTLHGTASLDQNVNIKSLKLSSCYRYYDKYCYWNTKCRIPSTPSPLKKTDDVQWYLAFEEEGDMLVEHITKVGETDYLLADLFPGLSGFDTTRGCKIEIE